MNAAVVLEPLIDAHGNLAVKTISPGIDRGANSAREAEVEEKLSTHDDEDPGSSRVERRGCLTR